ncbi:MAG TPA: sugar phosphate nucleotidyltransferase [Anaerolineae bacterium]|nr:sugar phosphate nucleotidyltransferase [Anaerolineae bacterium]
MSSTKNTRAIILAGGKGTRLYPYTAFIPKPLVPLGNMPILEILLRRLLAHNITDVTLTLGHLALLIKAYFHQHPDLADKLTLRYVEETKPTGTAGSLSQIDNLNDTFLVMNGDLLTDIDYNALLDFHRQQGAEITIATYARQERIDLGVLHVDNHQVTNYVEKPTYDYQVSMGVYVYEPSVLSLIPDDQYLDFPTLVLQMLDQGRKVCAFPWTGFWLDIGRPDDYAQAQELFTSGQLDLGI